MKRSLVAFLLMLTITTSALAQDTKEKPFSFSWGGITVTGTYSEGSLYRSVNGGVSILWGLISWGSSETIDCRSGTGICRIEAIWSLSAPRLMTSPQGEICFEEIKTWTPDQFPVAVSIDKDRHIRFVFDVEQLSPSAKTNCETGIYRQEFPILLGPELTRHLGLYDGPEEMGFLIPAGDYQLHKEGRLRFWSWKIPAEVPEISETNHH